MSHLNVSELARNAEGTAAGEGLLWLDQNAPLAPAGSVGAAVGEALKQSVATVVGRGAALTDGPSEFLAAVVDSVGPEALQALTDACAARMVKVSALSMLLPAQHQTATW